MYMYIYTYMSHQRLQGFAHCLVQERRRQEKRAKEINMQRRYVATRYAHSNTLVQQLLDRPQHQGVLHGHKPGRCATHILCLEKRHIYCHKKSRSAYTYNQRKPRNLRSWWRHHGLRRLHKYLLTKPHGWFKGLFLMRHVVCIVV